MSKRVSDQVVEIADRLELLLEKIKDVLPKPILEEDKILRLMKTLMKECLRYTSLVLTYLRIEPLIRYSRARTSVSR